MRRGVKILLIVMTTIFVVGVETASAQMSDLKFGKYGVEKIRLKSLRSGKGLAWVMTENSGKSFYMSDIKGTVYKNGKPFVTGKCKPVKVVAGNSKVEVDGEAEFCDGVSFTEVLKCIKLDPKEYKIDVSMTIFNADTIREVKKTGIELGRLLKKL